MTSATSSPAELIAAANAAVYHSKVQGRNRLTHASTLEVTGKH
ncbi:MAG: hypothetical protein O2960_03765 [Verrucomicrobia bacterium]|nr:hypothetical protein [Verrucomicrobiota bacterium]